MVKKPSIDAMPPSDRRDIRAGLKALRYNSRPLFITSAEAALRPGDQLDTTIALIAFATVLMSIIVTVILHGDIRCIHGPFTMLSDAARFSRCGRRAAYVFQGNYGGDLCKRKTQSDQASKFFSKVLTSAPLETRGSATF